MYTFKQVVSDQKDLNKRRRIVTVEFADTYMVDVYAEYDEQGVGIGTPTQEEREKTHTKRMEFSLDATKDTIKARFKDYMDDLNMQIDPVTDLNYTPEAEPAPDADEVAFQMWNTDLQKLVAAKTGEALGLELATPTQITTLTNKVQTGLKKTDERYISALAQYNKTI